ncbi:MAG: hypothetical protein OXN86_01080 [Chloroflexota bacterium]|nr:hypothetical protein [Chloroflexota bacterium]MDE2891088.1 hypothetical protein [Chloroflexota bacterium]
MPLEISQIDLQRTLFRFLTKSARKGELADRDAAAKRFPAQVRQVDLDSIADGMQQRLSEMYPDAPDLRGLLGGATAGDLAAIQGFDWVVVGIYTFGLPPTKSRSGTPESSAHRTLKEWAASNGDALNAPSDSVGVTERWFPSGDESDAAFIGESETLIVEVRPAGAEAHELQQALFTLVKMRAVRQAELSLGGRNDEVRVTLIVEERPGSATHELAESLGVVVFVK